MFNELYNYEHGLWKITINDQYILIEQPLPKWKIPYNGLCQEELNLVIGTIRNIKIHDYFIHDIL